MMGFCGNPSAFRGWAPGLFPPWAALAGPVWGMLVSTIRLPDALDMIADRFGWIGHVPPTFTETDPPQMTWDWILRNDRDQPDSFIEETRQQIAFDAHPDIARDFEKHVDVRAQLRHWDSLRRIWESVDHSNLNQLDCSSISAPLKEKLDEIQELARQGDRFIRRLARNIRRG